LLGVEEERRESQPWAKRKRIILLDQKGESESIPEINKWTTSSGVCTAGWRGQERVGER